ncbi:hypothetical protein [Crocosphaera sp. XPORK-15E]|uniref:hypothetical protein n=1 Tax=Crocosphaera sp. XPORK-15E TaxID=3110247 RepID=UPI002B21C7BA|nr:hypothetical protein [Crocosphaera sp. XPORK-15E]MEA5535127.1 hypothetical protein [Crocosphaera sp. XPORK-15E]
MMKPFKIVTLSILSTLLISHSAYADQCSYVEKEQALKAVSFLSLNQQIYLFCEPCGEKVPRSVTIESVAAGTVGYQDFWQVSINGKGVDLAYTYVPSSLEQKPINLAALSGCSAGDVSPFISF